VVLYPYAIVDAVNTNRLPADRIPFIVTNWKDHEWFLRNWPFPYRRPWKDYRHECPQISPYFWDIVGLTSMWACFLLAACSFSLEFSVWHSLISPIRLRKELVPNLVGQALRRSDDECCGLLAGRDGVITHVFQAENVASDPAKSYEIAPREIFQMMREFRAAGLDFLGIYHSHPSGENQPSARDIELAYYSEETYVILSPRADAAKPVRAFSIRDGRAIELEIQIV